MDKHARVARMGGLLASAYIAAGLVVFGVAQQNQAAHQQLVSMQATVHAKQAETDEVRAQVQDLQSLVAMQQSELRASRHVGLMRLDPGPWQTFEATFYTPIGGQGDGLTTYTGKRVHQGWTVAVDPRMIPLGSVIEVRFPDGEDKVLQALDTGGAIKGRHIDVFVWSTGRAVKLGVQRVQLRVLLRGR